MNTLKFWALLAITLLLSCCRNEDVFDPETGTGTTLYIQNTDKSTFMKYATQGVWRMKNENYHIKNMEVTPNAYKNLKLEPSCLDGGVPTYAILDENRVKYFAWQDFPPFEKYSAIYPMNYDENTREFTLGFAFYKLIVISINEHYIYCFRPVSPGISPSLSKKMGDLFIFEQLGVAELERMEKDYPFRD